MYAFKMKFVALCVSVLLVVCDAGVLPDKFNNPGWCRDDEFTCNPNQCVDYSALCNGVSDCEDGTDESEELCQALNSRSCQLPKITQDKSYAVNYSKHVADKPDDTVPEMSLLSYACNPGYGSGHFQSVCVNGRWTPAVSTCNKQCSKLDLPDMTYECYYNDKKIPCGGEYAFGTKVRISCQLPRHHPNHEEIICDENGEWNIKNVKCVTDCGKYTDAAGGKSLPWHVSVKRNNGNGTYYTFSGTMIAPNLVLTVARSIGDVSNPNPRAENFQVFVNTFLHEEYQESYKVKDIFLPPQGFFLREDEDTAAEFDDIAVLQLVENIIVDDIVMPICVDWSGMKLNAGSLTSSGKLVTSGSGQAMSVLNLKTYDRESCVIEIPNGTLQYDQFCGDVIDYKPTGSADWGTGYYVENPDNNLFYIKGVYRLGYGARGVKVFTDVPTHIQWINAVREKIEAEGSQIVSMKRI